MAHKRRLHRPPEGTQKGENAPAKQAEASAGPVNEELAAARARALEAIRTAGVLPQGSDPEVVKIFCERLKPGQIVYANGSVPVQYGNYQDFAGSTRINVTLVKVTDDGQMAPLKGDAFVDRDTFMTDGVFDIADLILSLDQSPEGAGKRLERETLRALAPGAVIYYCGLIPVQFLSFPGEDIAFRRISKNGSLGHLEWVYWQKNFFTEAPLNGLPYEGPALSDPRIFPRGASAEDMEAFFEAILCRNAPVYLFGKLRVEEWGRKGETLSGLYYPQGSDISIIIEIDLKDYDLSSFPTSHEVPVLTDAELQALSAEKTVFLGGLHPVRVLLVDEAQIMLTRVNADRSIGTEEIVGRYESFFTAVPLNS